MDQIDHLLIMDAPRILASELIARPCPTLADRFGKLKLVNEAPSSISKPESYQALQKQPKERIQDDRPYVDRFVPPISLLYDGFGVFEDVFRERCPVSGEDRIIDVKLWDEVNIFANRMAQFYQTEAERRGTVLDSLGWIFRARRDPHAVGDSRIGSHQIISDGHVNGKHGAIVFCIKCKNELWGISCEPSAELVSHIASSFKEQLTGRHRALFDGWRVPALGMTQIGERIPYTPHPRPLIRCPGTFVQFFGIVMLETMRVVPLTPMLPLTTPIEDEWSRQKLFLAFKAASIVLAKIQADVSERVDRPPPAIPLGQRDLPSVTEIKAIEESSPNIKFMLLERHDTKVEYRNLYHAQTVPGGEKVFVKFTQRYSPELHLFCARRGLAPKLRGFEELPGGWFGLVIEEIEKVDLVDPSGVGADDVETFLLELDKCKKEIQRLVEDFHKEGLVHGDLRLANMIFTKGTPRRMLLVDFDWGGKVSEVHFPRGLLAEELRAQDSRDNCLDRPITVGDDNRVLAGSFESLDKIYQAQ